MKKDKIDIQELFDEYLENTGLGGKLKSSDRQYIELRRAFYGAFGGILLRLPDWSEFTDKQLDELFEEALDQVTEFWNSEAQN